MSTPRTNSAASDANASQAETLIGPAIRAFRGVGSIGVTPQKLKTFLEETAEIAVSPARRLRELAIRLEQEPFEEGWRGLAAIYEAAAEADEKDMLVFHSWGIAAINWAEEWMTPDTATREAIAREAETLKDRVINVDELADAVTGILNHLELRRRARNVARQLGIEKWYSQLMSQESTQQPQQTAIGTHCQNALSQILNGRVQFCTYNLCNGGR